MLRRITHEALQLHTVHARVAAEAFQVQVFFQQVIEVAGRVDLDLVLQRGGRRFRADGAVCNGVLRTLLRALLCSSCARAWAIGHIKMTLPAAASVS